MPVNTEQVLSVYLFILPFRDLSKEDVRMEGGVETNPSDSTEGSTPIARANPFLRFAFTPEDTSVRNLVQGAFDILEEGSFL